MQNDDYEFHRENHMVVRPIEYIEKKVYVTDVETAVMVIEEIKQYCEDGLFNAEGRFDKSRFNWMMDRLIRKYGKGEIREGEIG